MQRAASWSAGTIPAKAAEILASIRQRAPRVHCITNTVAQNFTANVLLAIGAVPAMTISPEEIAEFVAGSGALLVNLGTLDGERREAIGAALEAAARSKVPWVLDPVFIDRVAARGSFARELIARQPAVVRLNAAEFASLSGGSMSQERLAQFAREHSTVVALSGQTDHITDGTRHAAIGNGHPYMAKVTAMGCAGSALVASCLAVEPDPMSATAAALTIIGVAGECAAETAKGPGSFAVGIIDVLHSLDAAVLQQRAQVT